MSRERLSVQLVLTWLLVYITCTGNDLHVPVVVAGLQCQWVNGIITYKVDRKTAQHVCNFLVVQKPEDTPNSPVSTATFGKYDR